MPKGYVLFTEDVTDREKMDAYSAAAAPTVFGQGGGALIVGGPEEVLEGEWFGTQTVLLEFESVEAARAWYNSDAYQAVIGQRHEAATSNGVIFAGFEMPG